MTLTLEASVRTHETAVPVQKTDNSPKRTGLLYVGETTVFHIPKTGVTEDLGSPFSKSDTISRGSFTGLLLNSNFATHKAGNAGYEIGRRMMAASRGPFTLFTWTTAQHAPLVHKQLDSSDIDMQTKIKKTEGFMHEAVVYQQPETQDPVTIDSPSSLNSSFVDVIDNTHNHVVIGALPEGNWRVSLKKGLEKLRDKKTSYSVLVKGALRRAIQDGENTEVAYDAIENATALVVTSADLEHLIRNHKDHEEPFANLSDLMSQAHRILKSQYIFVTRGRNGFIGSSRDERSLFVQTVHADPPIPEEDYLNAFIAGVVTEGNMRERLLRGSANAAILINGAAVDRQLPTQEEIKMQIDTLENGDVIKLPWSTAIENNDIN